MTAAATAAAVAIIYFNTTASMVPVTVLLRLEKGSSRRVLQEYFRFMS